MLSKVRLPLWVTSPTFILGLLWLLTAIADRLWFSLDNAPPAWDQGEHLNKALNFWRVWQSPERFSTNWWIDFWQQAPTYRAPLTYLFTVPILQWIGQTYDAATSVNLIFTAILLASVYHLGKHLFSATSFGLSPRQTFIFGNRRTLGGGFLRDRPISRISAYRLFIRLSPSGDRDL